MSDWLLYPACIMQCYVARLLVGVGVWAWVVQTATPIGHGYGLICPVPSWLVSLVIPGYRLIRPSETSTSYRGLLSSLCVREDDGVLVL